MHIAPGDPVAFMLGRNAPPEAYERTRKDLGLDKPLPVQYWIFLSSVAKGQMGQSLIYRVPTRDLIFQRLPKTLLLSVLALIVCYLIAIPIGVLAAVKRGSAIDFGVMAGATLGISIPSFWLGLILIMVFAVKLRWLPASGHEGLKVLILPVFTLAIGEAAVVARLIRSSMIESLGGDYVRTARAKGLNNFRVIFVHALRNAMLPTISVLGLQLGFLLVSTVVVENVFGWPGVGRLLVESISRRDYPVVQGTLLVLGVTIVLGNLIADVLYRVANPQIRYV
ncbi:MAG: glutathione ABC transporter permease GsiC [Chloroflexi bacterium]|nr:MAG: glutathione ABC transporter permease GsiC [Chloroflexota bacterium]